MSNTTVLFCDGLSTMYALLRQCRCVARPCWLGDIHHMEDGHIPKDILCGDVASGKRDTSCLQLHYKDVCKRDMKALEMNNESWKDVAANFEKEHYFDAAS